VRQVASRRRQERPINHPELRSHDLPAQDLELVPQHQQLDVLDVQAATATYERAEESPHREIEEREGHAPDPPTPAPTGDDTDIGALHAVRFPIEAGGALKDIIEAPSLDVVRGLDARTNIGYAVEPAAASASEPDIHEDFVSAYDLWRFAESARFVRHYPEQNPVLRDLLPTITRPTQIVAGRDDDLVPWSNNQYLDDLLPNSEIHPLDAGHFAWEQAAEEYGRLVVDWVSGGYRRVEAG
jgi:pimeloyl-ACP methyl ester carboxylesterase